MPPEPLPWERKEYASKDHRRHERGDAPGGCGGGSSSSTRWRESYQGSYDFYRASPRRHPSGHYRHGGGYYQVYPEDSAPRGFTPSHSDRFLTEDDGFRSPSGRYSNGYRSAYSRELQGSLRRSPSLDVGDIPRQQDHQEINATDFPRQPNHQESKAINFPKHPYHQETNATDFPRQPNQQETKPIDFPKQPYHQETNVINRPVTALVSSASQTSLNKENDKIDGADGLGTDQISGHQDQSLGLIPWKKWSRPASTKDKSKMEDGGTKVGLPLEKETPPWAPVVSSFASTESAFKKPRLGWGQGLAKYEKQKAEGSTEPSVGGLFACLSPSTTCSSSQGAEDKFCSRVGNNDASLMQNCDLLASTFPSSYEEVLANLDNLQVNYISSFDSLLADLIQSEDSFGGDSNLMGQSSVNKLLKLKKHVSNAYEKIENKIDLLEKELKAIIGDTKTDAYLDSIKPSDSLASKMSRMPLDDLSNEHKHLKDQRENCMEELSLEDNEHRPSSIFVEHEIVTEKTLSSFEKEPPGSRLEKLAASASLIEAERLKTTELSDTIESHGRGRLMVPHEVDIRPFVDDSVSIGSRGTIQGMADSNLVNLFKNSNRSSSKLAGEVFDFALPKDLPQSDNWGLVDFTSCHKHDMEIKEKLSTIKCRQKFKEHVLALKFMALRHSWKVKRFRTKSSRRSELSNPSFQNGSQKQRSNRSRPTSSAGTLTLVSTTEIMHNSSKLLSDSHIKPCRNHLKMPSLLNDRDKRCTRFVNHNRLIEDPLSFEKEKAMINPWSHDEKLVFMEMLARYGKDFTKISSFLDHKTTADCIEFYYKNHKSDGFKEVKKQLYLRKQHQSLPANTYLVASGKNRNRRKNVESLDLLGAATVMVAQNEYTKKIGKHAGSTSSRDSVYFYGANKVNISSQERESFAANVLVGISSTRSSEGISSHDTCSVGHAKNMNEEAILDVDDTCFSDEGCGELESADWTDKEKIVFIQALSMYGKDFTRIADCLRTRSKEQCKIFFSKARKCLALDAINQGCTAGVTPVSLTNRGISDIDDTCGLEMNSAVCSTQSCSKIDDDVSQPVANNGYEGISNKGYEGIARCASTDSHVETESSYEQDNNVLDKGNPESDNKADKQMTISYDVKQTFNEDNLQSDVPQKQSIVAASGCEAVKYEAADSADGEVKFEETGSIISLPVSVVSIRKSEQVEECLEAVPKQITASVSSVRDLVECSPGESMKKKADSNSSCATEVGLWNKKLANINSIANENVFPSTTKASAQNRVQMVSANNANCCRCLTFDSQVKHDMHPSTAKNPQTILLKQENDDSVPLNSFVANPSSVCFRCSPCIYSEALTSFLPLHVDQNMYIVKSYPLQSLKQEANGKANPPALEQLSQHQVESGKKEVSRPNHFLASDKHWKSNISTPHLASGGMSLSENQSEIEVRTCFKNCAVDVEKPRPGDLKLFGKILSTSTQKPGSSSNGNIQRSSLPKMDGASKMFSSSDIKDANQLVNAGSGQVNLETTYGFWDGKRIQTGFSSLPETASIFYKYLEAPTSTSHYPVKDGIDHNSFLTEYQQPYMPPLSANLKQIDSIPGLRKRTQINMIPGFQQQVRVTPLGTNMIGGRMLVGGVDPVPTLNVHFAARTEVFSSDTEPWRGDMGSRL
ncbi:uncharacterized protein LOC122002539 isoform X1 [Zingiber officinale]|uniref:uncharacterized protein LOC122002539 isoform X1 n=1 Tax=Zingiber officinale TaxID=94328 RepID=UPI001C4B01BF|nr:uncharacterized protein LOC122002539 isoform X1 [Zingiber officinale]XP_042413676.1 uncharacterized protein LOC122002539 isoform X1 [Zingiber officinale]